MKWFGPDNFSNACANVERAPVPIGEKCLHCKEPIGAGDAGYLIPHMRADYHLDLNAPHHIECFLRGIIGSVGHQMRQCSCYGFADLSEDGLSKREAARRAENFMRGNP